MIVTLTTDFGTSDPYVAQMKGVILSVNPNVTIVDITHEVPPQSITCASFILGISFSYFPTGTVHLAVVDPTVGSGRRGVIVSAYQHFFVGPDNGIFSSILEKEKGKYRAVSITHLPILKHPISQTFHGRDVFAPVAARLARGVDMAEFGPEVEDLTIISVHRPLREENRLTGEVIYIDRFGNAITNLSEKDVPFGFKVEHVLLKERVIKPARFYTDTSEELACLFNSAGFLELFAPLGSAADKFGIQTGTPVHLILSHD
ncbi:MAG TPA: SAM-dependent chlorinase/fluorinase [Syntrophales bacterium]|nr:SAM-dependent chlorinase/fluorinase [Syntrophales bacterium]HOL58729.1 SAM-dependent chlorinase/fluorinase [Syntrophales bacterium]HPO34983.1 SAM-dependent chlorinase/fluorinase [Syntrophales bacterium]